MAGWQGSVRIKTEPEAIQNLSYEVPGSGLSKATAVKVCYPFDPKDDAADYKLII